MKLEAPHYKSWILILLFVGPGLQAAAPKISENDIRQSMVVISRQLGVTCADCHQMNNLKSANKEAFKIAKAHLKMVADLNARRIRGLPKVDCFMCHQGHAKAPFKENLDAVKPAALPPAHPPAAPEH